MPSLIYIVSLSTSELYTIPIDLLAFNQKMGMEMTDESRLKKNVQLSYWSSSLLCCARSHFHTARIFDISKICRSHKILIIRIQINCSRECEMLGTTLLFVQKSASKLVYIYIWYWYIYSITTKIVLIRFGLMLTLVYMESLIISII